MSIPVAKVWVEEIKRGGEIIISKISKKKKKK